MMAYISLEYHSDGPPPSQVGRTLQGLGLRGRGTNCRVRAPSEAGLHAVLDRVHSSLKGSGVRYKVSLERPDRRVQEGRRSRRSCGGWTPGWSRKAC